VSDFFAGKEFLSPDSVFSFSIEKVLPKYGKYFLKMYRNLVQNGPGVTALLT